MNGGFVLDHLNQYIQRGPWMRVDGTFDATAPDREIDDAALSADQTDGGK